VHVLRRLAHRIGERLTALAQNDQATRSLLIQARARILAAEQDIADLEDRVTQLEQAP
jgi:hypothetical protein